MSSPRVLIVDDEQTLVASLAYGLEKRHFQPLGVYTGREALERVREDSPDVVLLDVWLPDHSGLTVLRELREEYPALPVIMITAHGETKTAVEAMKLGAVDFILKPFELEEVAALLRRTADYRRMEDELRFHRRRSVAGAPGLVEVRNPDMLRVVEQVRTAALSRARIILLMGESGTGKAMLARMIHDESERADKPFVEVNCAAIPATLFESQLFGHEKGAFTDARESQAGLIRLAEDGTLFLDEIGDMPLPLQAKLLQFLESQRFRPVGGRREYTVDARVVVATNRDLQVEVDTGRFRSDLYYRINLLPFTIPPLRQRPEDLEPLLEFFIEDAAHKEGLPPLRLAPAVRRRLHGYPWPGNVRELKNLVERWTILYPGQTITPAELPPEMLGEEAEAGAARDGDSIEVVLHRTERRLIQQALAETRGHRGQTAERLGISRHALKRRMQRLGMDGEQGPAEKGGESP